MKRYLLLGIAILMLVASVSGLAVDLQNPSDFSAQIVGMNGCTPATWIHNTSGGNSYVLGGTAGAATCGVHSQTSMLMTYSAASQPIGNPQQVWVWLLDSDGSSLDALDTLQTFVGSSRLELMMVGDTATLYSDGVAMDVVSGFTHNPYFIAWGIYSDDLVWGTTESRYVFGAPENGYFLMKDILNPAASGFYRANQTDPTGAPSLIFSNYFTSTFSKNSGNNETVILYSPEGGNALQYYTGTKWTGQIFWNLTQFFASGAGYGLYQTTINPQLNSSGFATSDWIPYIGSGANIEFDKNSYAIGETATLTVTISDAYYSVVTNPHVVIMDVFGSETNDDTAITFIQEPDGDWVGTSTYAWTDANAEGVYYGMIYATYSGSDVLMNYDTADLTSNLIVSGYVFDATTTSVISGATVNVTQGATTDSSTSYTDGNYTSTSDFSAHAPTTIVASMTGYETYQHVFTPEYAGSIQINITLMPTSPTYSGIALGGIARTPPYNRTINSATVYIVNTSDGHSYTVTTNSAGYYIQNDMAGASHWFDIWGSKTGYSNSSIYQKLVFGS